MSNPSDRLEKGFVDGIKEAEYQKTHNSVDKFIRDLGYSPRKEDSPAYKEGFNRGLEAGLKK